MFDPGEAAPRATVRAYSVTIDNLLGVDMVPAKGRFVMARAGEHAGLFWTVAEITVRACGFYAGCAWSAPYGRAMLRPLNEGAALLK